MRRTFGVGLVLLLMGVVLAPLAVRAQDPGVADAEIVLGLWSPFTGPTALLGTSERDGFSIWVSEINAAGGVHGRKIRLIAYDDAGSPQESLSAVRRLINQDKVFALVAGSLSGSTLPALPLITAAKVPFVSSMSTNRRLLDPPSRYVFRVWANEVAQVSSLIDWAVPKYGIKRPAIIFTTNDYGVGGQEAVARRMKEKFNLALVASERYNQGDQDFSAQLLRIKQATPDAVFVWAFAAEAGIIVRQAKELGITVQLFGGAGTATPLFPKGAGTAGVGFIADFIVPHLPDTSSAAPVVKYREALKKLHPNGFPSGRPSEYDLAGYGAGKVVEEALKRAGKELTRERFVDALETFKAVDTGVLFPTTFTKDNHEGTTEVQIVRVNEQGQWEVIPK
jgi:branched-chain amino acid transport system substrate-binding protein